MMPSSTVGQIEKKTQQRIVKLFREQLGYDYLGDWIDRENNRNVEPDLLRTFLTRHGHEQSLISRTLHLLDKTAGDQSKKLYDRNKAVYELLRYGVKVKLEVGENTVTCAQGNQESASGGISTPWPGTGGSPVGNGGRCHPPGGDWQAGMDQETSG